MKDRMDREKFKALSFWQKVQWILQYYGLAMVITALAAFVIVVFVKSVFGPGEQYALRVMILDDRQSTELCQAYSEQLGALLGGECDVTSYAESAVYEMQAFVVRLTSDELDLVIAPEEQMEQLMENGYLTDMTELPDDCLYCVTAHGGEPVEERYYIGETVRSGNPDNVPAAMDYFTTTE